MIRKVFVLTFSFVFLLSLLPVQVFAGEDLPQSSVIITEIRLGGDEIETDENTYKEYVTLYNQTDEEINLEGWSVEYAKNDFEVDSCDLPHWSSVSDGYKTDLEDYTLPSHSVLSIERQLNDDEMGSLRITEETSDEIIVHDLVGWGEDSPCFEGSFAPLPASEESLQRYIDCESGLPLDTDDNSDDFTSGESTPGELSETFINCPEPEPDEEEAGVGGGSDDSQNSCEGIIITELLPNPSGSDSGTGGEFIELHNPSPATISLEGCKLETTANSNVYLFQDIKLKPKQYKAFYNKVTDLTLTNSSGDNVYLIDTDGVELQDIKYQPDMDDDVGWAIDLESNKWSITYTLTPGEQNEIVEVKPCPEGQFRNLETNRCNKIVKETGLGPCPPGKFRNLETNRCKSIVAASSQLKPCDPDQYRNPKTNRCKKHETNSLKPCDPDQERNPKTNRCRKISTASQSNDNEVKDVLSVTQAQDQTSWTMAGISFIGAAGYGVWEWRSELLQKLLTLKNKLAIK